MRRLLILTMFTIFQSCGSDRKSFSQLTDEPPSLIGKNVFVSCTFYGNAFSVDIVGSPTGKNSGYIQSALETTHYHKERLVSAVVELDETKTPIVVVRSKTMMASFPLRWTKYRHLELEKPKNRIELNEHLTFESNGSSVSGWQECSVWVERIKN